MDGVPQSPAPQRAQPIGDRVLQALCALAADTPLWLRVNGSCMTPLLPCTAAVQVSRQRFYLPGDLLVFRSREGRLFTHRMIGTYRRNGRWCIVAQPDQARAPDSPIPAAHVVGRVCGGDVSPLLVDIPLRHRARALGRFARHLAKRLACGRHVFRRPLPRTS